MTSLFSMFDQPWQWAALVVIVLVLLGGTRIRDVMATLKSGLHDFKRPGNPLGAIASESPDESAHPARTRISRPRRSGRNLHGVPVYSGALRLPEPHLAASSSRRLKGWLAVTGILLECGFIVPTGSALAEFLTVAVIIGLIGSAWSVVYWLHVYSMRRFAGLVSIRDLSARTGRPELTFLLSARQQGIEPRCIIDGEEYYDAGDLGDASVLLRPAEGTEPDSLLRPVSSPGSEDTALLRPSGRES